MREGREGGREGGMREGEQENQQETSCVITNYMCLVVPTNL